MVVLTIFIPETLYGINFTRFNVYNYDSFRQHPAKQFESGKATRAIDSDESVSTEVPLRQSLRVSRSGRAESKTEVLKLNSFHITKRGLYYRTGPSWIGAE